MSSSIHPTRYGTYELRWREHGKQKSATRKTKKEAEQLQEEVERRKSGNRPMMRDQDVPTLKEFAVSWLARRTDLELSTQKRYAEQLETHVLPCLGHFPLTRIKARMLAEWQEQRLSEGAGPAVLGKAQTLLGQILDKAVLPHEYLDDNPARYLDAPKYKKRAHRWLTAGDVEALRLWFLERDDLRSATIISIQAYVGIRPEDTLARMWSDLDTKLSVTTKNVDGEILPGSKTGEGYKRRVEVPEMVLGDLEDWRLESKGHGLIFPRTDGQPWTKNDYDNWRSRHPKGKKNQRPRCFKAAAESIGIPELRPYDLRHTGASLMAAAGWSVVEIAHQLGHSPTESQKTYQHLIEADRDRPRLSIDGYIREARGLAPERITA